MLLVFNPQTYEAVYGSELNPEAEEDFEEIVPESETDVQRMIADLAALGVKP